MLAKIKNSEYKSHMSSPEEKLISLNHDMLEAEDRAASKKYGGRTSLMFVGVNSVSGAFVTECLLEMSGAAERMPATEHYGLVAAGGLAATIAILRKAYKHNGINLAELVQWRGEKRKAQSLRAQYEELSSWMDGPGELTPSAEDEISRFKAELDT